MRWTLPLLALLVAAAVWAGGELHRSNCLRAGHVGCTVLPWNDGRAVQASSPLQGADAVQRDRIERALARAAR